MNKLEILITSNKSGDTTIQIKKQGNKKILITALAEAIKRDKELYDLITEAYTNINFNNK